MPIPTSPMRKAWYRWKSLRLPWRKRFLVGLDLQGNTFWEFRDALSSHKHRMRRIVQYPTSTHYSEIKISPQWHQWLRQTRSDPPSLAEQSQDVIRQQNLKVLAAEADARWASKPSYLESLLQARVQPLPALEGKDRAQSIDTAAVEGRDEYKDKKQAPDGARHYFVQKPVQESKNLGGKKAKEDPWKQARGGPSDEWQPAAWNGNTTARR